VIAVYIVLVLGISTIFWSFVGLLRLANEQYTRRITLGPPLSGRMLGLLQRWPLANRLGPGVHGAHTLPAPRAHRGQIQREHGRHRARDPRILPANVAVLLPPTTKHLSSGRPSGPPRRWCRSGTST
jgi:hypothetical protein